MKKVPIAIKKLLESTSIEESGRYYFKEDPEGRLFLNTTVDEDFYFVAEALDIIRPEAIKDVQYEIEFMPSSDHHFRPYKATLAFGSLQGEINKWKEFVEKYNTKEVDDPILVIYEKTFESFLEIMDEDAETAPFSEKIQMMLVAKLDGLSQAAETERIPDNAKEVDDFQSTISEIIQQLGSLSKKAVVRKLRTLAAKGMKVSLTLCREVFVNVVGNVLTGNMPGWLTGG
jgi:DNA-binding Lrp family transcriptional regulator